MFVLVVLPFLSGFQFAKKKQTSLPGAGEH
jgi:hypothetical protein